MPAAHVWSTGTAGPPAIPPPRPHPRASDPRAPAGYAPTPRERGPAAQPARARRDRSVDRRAVGQGGRGTPRAEPAHGRNIYRASQAAPSPATPARVAGAPGEVGVGMNTKLSPRA